MKYNIVNNRKIPSLSKTKGFKPMWFVIGFIFHFFSLPIAYLLYAVRYPRIDTISDLHCDLFYVSTSLHTFRYLYLTSHTYEFERRRWDAHDEQREAA